LDSVSNNNAKQHAKKFSAGKIIEENFENPKRGVQKLRERISAMAQIGKLDLFDNRTNQEIAKFALNLHLVFKEPQDLCDPGSVLKRHGCGERKKRRKPNHIRICQCMFYKIFILISIFF